MSAQPVILQVVILRDGLLVGTEVFVPGQYSIGAGNDADLKLDDAAVADAHATLYFQNGRVAVRDGGTGALFVNGHRVNACEVRAVDEIVCGPFTLKVRVLSQKPAAKPAPPPEVAQLLGAVSERAPGGAAADDGAGAGPAAARSPGPSTVVSARRQGAAAAPEPRSAPEVPAVAPPVLDEPEERTESVALGAASLARSQQHEVTDPQVTAPITLDQPPPSPSHSTPGPSTRLAPAPPLRTHVDAPAPRGAPRASAGRANEPAADEGRRRVKRARPEPAPAPQSGARGRPRLVVEQYWGMTRTSATSHPHTAGQPLLARDDDAAPVPLWGFGTEGRDFVLAEGLTDGRFRVFVPPQAAVERRSPGGDFAPAPTESLEVEAGGRSFVTLPLGHAVRLSSDSGMTLVASVHAALPRPFANPLATVPWLVVTFLALFGSAFAAFAITAGRPDEADFAPKNVAPVAVRLIAPPKKEERKRLEEKAEKLARIEPKKQAPKVERALPPAVPQETKKALKSVEKLVAAGPAMKDLLAAVDKLGAGPGAKNAKTDFKLSGLIGKAPIANAGVGTFGLGSGLGGTGIKGAELLRGKGGAGIGALGVGSIGKGRVGGAVTAAVSRNVGTQGSIDKDAVARAINSHLGEVSSCYERALLKEPGLAGKIVLEWQITTSGTVGFAKTKSSTMKSAAVEACILSTLKSWRFPPAKDAGVLITYPFMFNSVGF